MGEGYGGIGMRVAQVHPFIGCRKGLGSEERWARDGNTRAKNDQFPHC
jgi:hypothetical protein